MSDISSSPAPSGGRPNLLMRVAQRVLIARPPTEGRSPWARRIWNVFLTSAIAGMTITTFSVGAPVALGAAVVVQAGRHNGRRIARGVDDLRRDVDAHERAGRGRGREYGRQLARRAQRGLSRAAAWQRNLPVWAKALEGLIVFPAVTVATGGFGALLSGTTMYGLLFGSAAAAGVNEASAWAYQRFAEPRLEDLLGRDERAQRQARPDLELEPEAETAGLEIADTGRGVGRSAADDAALPAPPPHAPFRSREAGVLDGEPIVVDLSASQEPLSPAEQQRRADDEFFRNLSSWYADDSRATDEAAPAGPTASTTGSFMPMAPSTPAAPTGRTAWTVGGGDDLLSAPDPVGPTASTTGSFTPVVPAAPAAPSAPTASTTGSSTLGRPAPAQQQPAPEAAGGGRHRRPAAQQPQAPADPARGTGPRHAGARSASDDASIPATGRRKDWSASSGRGSEASVVAARNAWSRSTRAGSGPIDQAIVRRIAPDLSANARDHVQSIQQATGLAPGDLSRLLGRPSVGVLIPDGASNERVARAARYADALGRAGRSARENNVQGIPLTDDVVGAIAAARAHAGVNGETKLNEDLGRLRGKLPDETLQRLWDACAEVRNLQQATPRQEARRGRHARRGGGDSGVSL